ncbi:ComEA protein, partial [human gut metagenome]
RIEEYRSQKGPFTSVEGIKGVKAIDDVLSADVVVVERPSLVLGQDDDAAGAVGKAFEHRWFFSSARASRSVAPGCPPARQ